MGITAHDQIEGNSWLTTKEFTILTSICNTLLPSLEPPAGSSEILAAYYRRSASDLRVAEGIVAKLGEQSLTIQHDIRRFLSLFSVPVISRWLINKHRAFVELEHADRERYLDALANSRLKLLRQGFQGLKRLAGLIYFTTLDQQGHNPNWPILDYIPADSRPTAKKAPIIPATLQTQVDLETDVIVIGSGAGGSVVASELAQAGKRVLILEQGGYNHEGNFRLNEGQAFSELFLNQGALATKDLGVIMMAGSTLGGGTVVNWMSSFRMRPEILAEWDTSSGLAGYFTGPELEASYAFCEQRMRVNSLNSQHNRQNQILFDGALALGYHVGTIPRNAIDCEQRCGPCTFGCSYGSNQSAMKTFIQDAYDHGAQVMVRTRAERILTEYGKVVGVQATVLNPQTQQHESIRIRATTVVVCAGAIQSPALLLRSGLTNSHIGQHLYLHPSAISVGQYRESVYAWKGVLQSAYSDQFIHLDGNYGYKLEVAPAHPGIFGLATPWHTAQRYRDEMINIANLASIMILTRDKGAGRIQLDRFGSPIIDYTVSAYDRTHIWHGLCAGARIHAAAGAERVISLQSKPTDLYPANDPILQGHLLREFDDLMWQNGLKSNQIVLFSAHQMGTCRLGTHADQSVVDENHQSHNLKGLFICDSSVFPSACGVNPMLTIMALAHRAAQRIKQII
ncbi:FAD-dependent oxidoreductase [Herpetosiphon giganteus]|uniref:FAD-dependent oxidoreductase n=1 Tax=Herpetosiphon giganteus TaxID=2029754 RepID=UPI00195CAA98|nr:GMC family oxidoreductase [Herpetosiphon giganteus]MBM7845199.1 choline dehydrogenase-like flavoprotein [Herpetosiphon giganteus]